MAGGKATTFDNDLLKLILNATPIANIADNAATSPLTNLYFALHTADPGVGGAQNTSETTYSGYARVAVARTTAGFTVSGNSCVLVNPVNFGTPADSAGVSLTWFSIGIALSGAGKILYRGPLSPTITIVVGTLPQMTTGTTITES